MALGLLLFAGLALTDIYVCPIKAIFHLPCPGCGLTRGFSAILHFHLLDAIHYNLLSIPLFLTLGIATMSTLSDLLLKTKFIDQMKGYRFTRFQIINLIMIFALNWSMNILRGI